jgi:hypothetical protein
MLHPKADELNQSNENSETKKKGIQHREAIKSP